MRSILLLSILAGAAFAEMDLQLLQRDISNLLPRETKISGSIASKCQSALSDIVSHLPTPAPQLVSAESKLMSGSNTDPCSFSPPSSLSKVYSVYTSELFKWYSSHSHEVDAAFKVCTDLKATAASLLKVCSTDSNVPTALRAAATTSGSSGSGSSESSSTSKGAAPRETGMAIAAGAAALGVLAVAL
ncbi:hypothetical protein LIA77_11243 [Sarocladium implicatum]|nr:hypothetical protein LIA77_11243 [Sarocladium implicatum]